MKRIQKTKPTPIEFNDPIRMRIARRVQDIETAKLVIREYEANDGEISDYDLLADAYAYFMAEPENDVYKIARNRFKWMASATVGSADNRYYLRYILSQGDYMTASNGTRFQRVEANRKMGFYMPDRRKIICQYPQMRFPPLYEHILEPNRRYQLRDAKSWKTEEDAITGPGVKITIPDKPDTPPIIVDRHEINQAVAGFRPDDWIDIQTVGISNNLVQSRAVVMASADDKSYPKYATLLGLTADD